MKKSSFAEAVKTVLICILLVTLVCLSAVYMFLYQQPVGASFTKEDYLKLKSENTIFSYADYLDSSFVCPAAVAVKADYAGKPYLLTALSSVEPAANDLLPYYSLFFRDGAFVGALSAESGQEAIRLALTGDYLYVKYHTELPKSLIGRLSSPELMADEMSSEPIYELFIFAVSSYLPVKPEVLGLSLSGSYALCALACDLSGNCYLYCTEDVPQITGRSSFNISFYNAYSTFEKTEDFCFLYSTVYPELIPNAFSGAARAGTLILSDKGVTLPALTAVSRFSSLCEKENIDSLLSLFKMNPDKVSVLSDRDGGVTYIEDTRSLKLSPNGFCSFSALSSEGAPSLLLSDNTTDMLDCVGAGALFLSSLPVFSSLTESEDVSVVLTEITAVDSSVRLSFGFTYRNIPLLANGKHICASFELYEGKITDCFICFSSPVCREGEHRLAGNRLELLSSIVKEKARFDMRFAYEFGEDGLSTALWCKCFAGAKREETEK